MFAAVAALSPGDLVRNCLLVDQTEELQQQIQADCFTPLDDEFGRSNSDEQFASFVQAFLALRTGRRP